MSKVLPIRPAPIRPTPAPRSPRSAAGPCPIRRRTAPAMADPCPGAASGRRPPATEPAGLARTVRSADRAVAALGQLPGYGGVEQGHGHRLLQHIVGARRTAVGLDGRARIGG